MKISSYIMIVMDFTIRRAIAVVTTALGLHVIIHSRMGGVIPSGFTLTSPVKNRPNPSQVPEGMVMMVEGAMVMVMSTTSFTPPPTTWTES